MNLRCTYCQTPFSVGRMEKLAALQRMQAENLHHYDAFCPRCRRANSVSRQRLEQFTPGWQEGLKTLEAEAAQIEKNVTEPVPAPAKTEPVPVPVEASRNRHTHKPAIPAPVKVESEPVAKPAAKAKPAATKTTSSPKGKTAAKPVSTAKPAAKAKKPATKKK
jgi:hypothetical protein